MPSPDIIYQVYFVLMITLYSVMKSQLGLFKTKQRAEMYTVTHLAKAHG